MKLAWMPALMVGVLLSAGATSTALAQASGGGSVVAVLDLAKVFEQHPGLKTNIKTIQGEYKIFQQQVIDQRKQLTQRVKQLEELKTASPEFKQLEADLAQTNSSMAVTQRLKQKEFVEREAQQHYRAYLEVLEAVQRIAQRHNISLVLRYDSEPIDANNNTSVMRGIMRGIVYQHQLDITDLVVQDLFATAQRPQGPAPR